MLSGSSSGRYIYMNDPDKLDEEVGKGFPKRSALGIEQRSGNRQVGNGNFAREPSMWTESRNPRFRPPD